MKYYRHLYPRGRSQQNPEKVPFRELIPLSVKNSVSNKTDSSATGICLPEMTLLLQCFKNNNYNETPCQKELLNFQKCYTNHQSSCKTDPSVSTYNKKNSSKINEILTRYSVK